MDPALANLGWTEDQWNRICSVVSEEAQRARVCAQALPLVGLDDPSAVSIPKFRLSRKKEPYPYPHAGKKRLSVNSTPDLYLTTISVNVSVRSHEASDPELSAALGMFRRAANEIARIEDALILSGRKGATLNHGPFGDGIYTLTEAGTTEGLLNALPQEDDEDENPPADKAPETKPADKAQEAKPADGAKPGESLFNEIVGAIGNLESHAQTGPYACLLSNDLFNIICSPTDSFVLPRDRILPFLQGPLLRSGQIPGRKGCVIALGGTPVEVVIASDVSVRYLQTTPEPRYLFRVSERIALRIKETDAIQLLSLP